MEYRIADALSRLFFRGKRSASSMSGDHLVGFTLGEMLNTTTCSLLVESRPAARIPSQRTTLS
jgi:hypothetical protein